MMACEGTFSLRSNPSGRITADKRLRCASPNCLRQLVLSAERYMKFRTPHLETEDIYIDLI